MQSDTRVETVVVLESHIDHLTGEEIGHVFGMLHAAGALDVLWIPGIMKKNRPGGALRVICSPEQLDSVQAAFFRHTHTLGIRRSFVERVVLPREETHADAPDCSVRAKRYALDGKEFLRPEYEDLAATAESAGTSLPGLRFGSGKRKNKELIPK